MGCCCCSSLAGSAECPPSSSASGSSSASASSSSQRHASASVNVNVASAGQLVALPGIGPQKADAIVAYRQKHGPFADAAALKRVPGLGPATVAKLEGLVSFGTGRPEGQPAGLKPPHVGPGQDVLGANEALFFPDPALPCRNYLAGAPCTRKDCKFAHGGTGLCRILALLAGVRQRLDVAVFAIAQEELAAALEAAHKRGVTVRILTDDEQAKDAKSLVPRLKAQGLPVLMDSSKQLHMHHKFAVLDDQAVLYGSFNWTGAAVKGSNENLVISRSAGMAQRFAAEFARMWADFSSGVVGKAPSGAFAGNVAVLFFPDAAGTNVEMIRTELLTAKTRIDVAVFTLTHDGLSDALIVQRKRGVAVRVITDNKQAKVTGADAARLADAGIPVRTDKSFFAMHHKFAVIDGSTLINGSFNWTRQAHSGNQEDCVITRSAGALAQAFTEQFEQLWTKFAP